MHTRATYFFPVHDLCAVLISRVAHYIHSEAPYPGFSQSTLQTLHRE